MEELRERRVKTTARKNKNNDYLVGVMTTQIVVCLVVFGIVFAVTKLNPAAGEELRKFYDTALSVDWNSQEAMASVKRAGSFCCLLPMFGVLFRREASISFWTEKESFRLRTLRFLRLRLLYRLPCLRTEKLLPASATEYTL